MEENSVRAKNLAFEEKVLSLRASFSKNTRGREREEQNLDYRTDYQKDRDRILYSDAFNRLRKKTQMFANYNGDYYRTRLIHSLEVSQLARTAARLIGLNEDLTEAMALGHDLGHAPFGHAGEEVLNELCENGFTHAKNGVRVVRFLENGGEGLNLTYEVLNGIEFHSFGGEKAETLEGRLVEFCDKIAYINHDIEDSVRAKILKPDSLPKDCVEVLGNRRRLRINRLISSIVENSGEDIAMEGTVFEAFIKLRKFLFDNLYCCEKIKRDSDSGKRIVEKVFRYYEQNYFKLPNFYRSIAKDVSLNQAVCDYVSGMSDDYITGKYHDIFA